MKKTKLSESMEKYLETIYFVEKEKRAARAKDIAQRLDVKASSVTGALRNLSSKGLVNYAPYDIITLTDEGRALAAELVHRRKVLNEFFSNILQLDDDEVTHTSYKIQYCVSEKVLSRLIKFIEFINLCPKVGQEWLISFMKYSSDDLEINDEECVECMEKALEDLKDKVNK